MNQTRVVGATFALARKGMFSQSRSRIRFFDVPHASPSKETKKSLLKVISSRHVATTVLASVISLADFHALAKIIFTSGDGSR